MKPFVIITISASLAIPALAFSSRDGHGLIGYGIKMYQPPCAFACQSSISNPLDCPMDSHDMEGMEAMKVKRMSHDSEKPSPECYANSKPYLQTLAYCMDQRCPEDVKTSARDKFFEMSIGGRLKQPPVPMYSYVEALRSIEQSPTNSTPADEMLMEVSLVADEDYVPNFNGNHGFELVESKHSLYRYVVMIPYQSLSADSTSIILISTGILIPIAASFLRSHVLPRHLASRFNAYFNYPPAVGSHHSVPIFNLMIMPTRGQSLFLFYLVAINIIFCSIGHKSRQPNSWYASSTEEIRSFVGNRTGALSLVNIALSVLYAGRNNVLISLTDWSHTTFLLLHRWVASIATLQACIHSAIYLYNYMASGEHATEAKLDYWIWGVVATLGMSILLPTSILPIRQKFYELFLVWHVVLSFFVILGSYLHILLRFQKQWGYELWMYIAFAFWGFDRLYRLVRLARNGVCKAQITIIDEDYIRLDIPGITGEGQAYLYFPTLTWRVWENHPFSIAGGMLQDNTSDSVINPKTSVSSSVSSADNSPTSSSDIEKAPKPAAPTSIPKLGLSFIIRTHSGTTSLLRSRSSLPVLVEAPYAGSLVHPTHATLNHRPRLLCIAGGVGVTALLPLLAAHRGSRKLAWGARHSSLINGLRDLTESNAMAGVTIETTVGRRMDVKALVEQEAVSTSTHGSLAVVVSGPPGMADEVRMAVAAVAGRTCEVEFVEESYSW
jgi:hypothetical protein